MIYANYIRNKMRHLVKTVFASGYPLKIISKFKKKAANYTIHGKTEIGKNLIPYPYSGFGGEKTKTVNGITFTDNGDGTVTVNGTAAGGNALLVIYQDIVPSEIDKTQTYTFSIGTSLDTSYDARVALTLYKDTTAVQSFSVINQFVLDLSDYDFNRMYCYILIKENKTLDNITIKPMLEPGDTATEYEPYTEYGVGDKTKNILPYPYANTTKTVNGVTFTDNGDGTVTANGTATANATFYIKTADKNFKPDSSTLYFSGCPAGGSSASYRMTVNAYKQTESGYTYVSGASDTGNGVVLNLNDKDYSQLEIVISVLSGTTADNLVFKPQLIRLDDEANNLMPYPYANTTKTVNGITFTDNGDGSITVNGTATDKAWYPISTLSAATIYAKKGIYVLAGCPSGGSTSTYYLQCYIYNETTQIGSFRDYGVGIIKDLNSYTLTSLSVNLNVMKGTTVENLVFKPMLVRVDYEPCGYKIPLVNSGKNLIPYPYVETTKTENGISFTDNGDGGITVNGTATANAYMVISDFTVKPNTDYYLSGCPAGGSSDTYYLNARGFNYDIGNGSLIRNNVEFSNQIQITVKQGTTINNLVFKPMLKIGETATEYEPYRAPDTTTVYHNAQLKDGESINCKADDLPELQLHKGENNITADTTIKPSAIDIKYLN